MLDLDNSHEEVEKIMDENTKQQMSMIMHALDERLPKSDNVAQGTHKDSVHVEQTSINKRILGGFILIMEVIRDGFEGVSNFPRLI